MKTKILNSVYDKLFNVYLFLMKYGYSHSNNHRVYDHYGIIDTLGYNTENTRFTWCYSEEMGCVHSIKLPFGYSIELINYNEREIRIEKTPNGINNFEY